MAAVTVALVGFFAFLILRVTAPQMTPLFTDLSLEDSAAIVKDLERQAIPYELKNDGAIILVPQGPGAAPAHEARRRRPAQGRRRRLRDLRQVGRARRHQLRPEHQSPARARRRARPHHPRASTGCRRRACTWCCPSGRCSRATRPSPRPRSCSRCAARSSRSRCARSATSSPPRSTGSSPSGSRSSTRAGRLLADGARRRQRRSASSADERQAAFERRLREQVESDRHLGGRPGPRPRAAHRRFRLQPRHPDLGQIRSGRPRACARARPARRSSANGDGQRGPGHGRQRAARRASASRRAPAPQPREQSTQDRGNRQLRDFPHHQDRSDRGRPRQPHLGRGAGRRHLRQERQGRSRLSAARQGGDRPHRRAGALGDRLRPEARRPGRGRQPALRRRAGQRRSPEPTGLAVVPAVHQGRHHALASSCW